MKRSPVFFTERRSAFAWLSSSRFEDVGTLFSKNEVRTIELADGGPLFTGDCSGELKVWRWAPQQDQDREAASAAHS